MKLKQLFNKNLLEKEAIYLLAIILLIPFVKPTDFGYDNPNLPKIENPAVTTTTSGTTNSSNVSHNELYGLQGGQSGGAGEYYHMNESSYNHFIANAWKWLTEGVADTLYADIQWDYNQTSNSIYYYNQTSNSLYYYNMTLPNQQWAYNMTSNSIYFYNQSTAYNNSMGTIIYNHTAINQQWAYNQTLPVSTWAYNQTESAWNIYSNSLLFKEISTPANPSEDHIKLYGKDDGAGTTRIYSLDSSGVEIDLTGGGGGCTDLDCLVDTLLTDIQGNQVLLYDSIQSQWVNAKINHTMLGEIGTNTHAQIDYHLSNTSNPHNVTAEKIDAVNKSGGDQTIGGIKTFSSIPVLPSSNPTSDNQATRKAYVDSLITSTPVRQAVVVASTTELSEAGYDNGVGGVGATLTHDFSGRFPDIDGVTVLGNERILYKDASIPIVNGIYQLSTVGDDDTPYVLTRTLDFDTASLSEVTNGALIPVLEGTVNGNRLFALTTTGTITIGVTNLDFTQFSAPTIYSGGDGIAISGTTIYINNLTYSGVNYTNGKMSISYDAYTLNLLGNKLRIMDSSVNSTHIASSLMKDIYNHTITGNQTVVDTYGKYFYNMTIGTGSAGSSIQDTNITIKEVSFVAMTGYYTTWTNMPAALTLFPTGLTVEDLRGAQELRIVEMMGSTSSSYLCSPLAKVWVQYSTNRGSTWTNLSDTNKWIPCNVTVGGVNPYNNSWSGIPAGAKGDVWLRMVGVSGNGVLDPRWSKLAVQFKMAALNGTYITSSWQRGASTIYNDTANVKVGIGVVSPVGKLNVYETTPAESILIGLNVTTVTTETAGGTYYAGYFTVVEAGDTTGETYGVYAEALSGSGKAIYGKGKYGIYGEGATASNYAGYFGTGDVYITNSLRLVGGLNVTGIFRPSGKVNVSSTLFINNKTDISLWMYNQTSSSIYYYNMSHQKPWDYNQTASSIYYYNQTSNSLYYYNQTIPALIDLAWNKSGENYIYPKHNYYNVSIPATLKVGATGTISSLQARGLGDVHIEDDLEIDGTIYYPAIAGANGYPVCIGEDMGVTYLGYSDTGCATASPFYYSIRENNEETTNGIEFLKNLKRQNVESTQTVSLEDIPETNKAIIREKKLEVSYIDSIRLMLMGVYTNIESDGNLKVITLKPVGQPELLTNDKGYKVMKYGDEFLLEWEQLPKDFEIYDAKLIARGYYIPADFKVKPTYKYTSSVSNVEEIDGVYIFTISVDAGVDSQQLTMKYMKQTYDYCLEYQSQAKCNSLVLEQLKDRIASSLYQTQTGVTNG